MTAPLAFFLSKLYRMSDAAPAKACKMKGRNEGRKGSRDGRERKRERERERERERGRERERERDGGWGEEMAGLGVVRLN